MTNTATLSAPPAADTASRRHATTEHATTTHATTDDIGHSHPHAPVGEFSPVDFRNTLGHFASGITIITGREGDAPVGMTCQSFFSQSIDPPLISFSVMETSTTYPRLRAAGRFCVNVLASAQQGVSAQFGRSGGDKWAGIEWDTTSAGNPVLRGSLMWVDCTLENEFVAGDHTIVIGRVREMSPMDGVADEPLLFFKGAYRYLGSPNA